MNHTRPSDINSNEGCRVQGCRKQKFQWPFNQNFRNAIDCAGVKRKE